MNVLWSWDDCRYYSTLPRRCQAMPGGTSGFSPLKQENNMPLDKSRPTRYNNTSLYITQCYYTRMVLMPAVRKVSKEQIIDAAVEVLRDNGFSAINAIYSQQHTIALRALQGLFLRFAQFHRHDTRPAKADITPPAPRWSISQRRSTSSAHPNTSVTPGRCTAQHSRLL